MQIFKMLHIPLLLKIIRNTLCISLLCIMVWQQWTTFLRYESKFKNPVQFTKQVYGNDYISQYENRFEEIKKIFPAPVHLTYFGEPNEDYATGSMHYSLTQYYLAPNLIFITKFYLNPSLILRNDISRDTLLYNLYNSIQIDPVANFHLNNGWHILKDFKNGLILLAK